MVGGVEELECQVTVVSLVIQQGCFWKQESHLKMKRFRLFQQKMECHTQGRL